MMQHDLLIVGASARAAAQAAVRSGFRVYALDMFADEDLRHISQTRRLSRYPRGIFRLAAKFPSSPWMYTGALENYPRLIAQLSSQRTLWGNSPAVLRQVRHPKQLANCLAEHNIRTPEIRNEAPTPSHDQWIQKPYRSGGGVGVRFATSASDASMMKGRASYVQKFISGDSVSGVFVGARGKAVFLGGSRQLVGAEWTGAPAFAYCGSIGPLPWSAPTRDQWEKIGSELTAAFGLTGLFGVDAIQQGDQLWVLEVNPRYTASIEILERASDWNSVAWHVAACAEQRLESAPLPRVGEYHGKAFAFATETVHIGPRFQDWVHTPHEPTELPAIADIPSLGTTIPPRHPICTVFACGPSLAAVESQLRARVSAARAACEVRELRVES